MFADAPPGAGHVAGAEPRLARPSTAWQLPVELLLQCLLAADLVTRIRASYVCQTWREAALAERRLWDSFACSRFRDNQHEDAMFALLDALLLRSRPLPFHLTVPHLDGRRKRDYTKRLLALEALDVFRLAAYHGPTRLFRLLNATCAPLPNLLCLDFLRSANDGHPDSTTIDLVVQFGARCLPNLQELAAPNVRFLPHGTPFGALRSITLEGVYGHHRALFAHCPSLVRMNITESALSPQLPDPPVPASLKDVSLQCSRPTVLRLLEFMQHWCGIRVPRLVAREVSSLRGIFPLFLASHERPVELRLLEDEDETAILSTTPHDDSVWEISPSPLCADEFLASIERPTSERLTSLCVAFSRLGALFAAQLQAPGLEKLELRVHSTADADPPLLRASDKHCLRAPRLRGMSFALDADCAYSVDDALGVLRISFRELLVYDAELLETITVSRCAEHACAGFALFAKEYVLSAR